MSIPTPAPVCGALAQYTAPTPEKQQRPRGRPKTRTPQHYEALRADYLRMAEWFSTERGRPHQSDMELLKAYFSDRFQQEGKRISRVDSADFRSKLKTLRNELSKARQCAPAITEQVPRNGVLPGRLTDYLGEVQARALTSKEVFYVR